MTVTHHPLHRSGRAALPHPAPTLGNNAKPHERVRMTNAHGRKPACNVALHPSPGEMALAAALQGTPPQSRHRFGEGVERGPIHRHAVFGRGR
jgi:hypothetical protein